VEHFDFGASSKSPLDRAAVGKAEFARGRQSVAFNFGVPSKSHGAKMPTSNRLDQKSAPVPGFDSGLSSVRLMAHVHRNEAHAPIQSPMAAMMQNVSTNICLAREVRYGKTMSAGA
jgi:hypothetical protein